MRAIAVMTSSFGWKMSWIVLLAMAGDIRAQEEPGWQQRAFVGIEEAATLPPDQAIPKLNRFLTWTAGMQKLTPWERLPDHKLIYDAAQAKLLAIPGHAEWHRDEIERLRANVDPQDPSTNFVFQQRRMEHIEDLGHIPSPETVRVLGEMLDDPRDDPPPKPLESPMLWYSTRHWAAASLGNLGIVHAPADNSPTSSNGDERVAAWKLWYAQVKAGTRTFRFEGSDVEHRLAPPPDGRRPSKDPGPSPSPKSSPPPTQATTASEPAKAAPTWPWIVGIATLTAAGLWWLKRRKPAPPTTQSPPAGRDP